jgi:hypothetical protein
MTKKASRHLALPWTQAEDDELRALALTDASPRDIAIQLNRSEIAIRSRANKLHVLLKKTTLKILKAEGKA